ncbi:MAG: AAA family ATPase [Deltaproteobacteria bacterium]|nr:AAA family ATPase [Deltaproteobacteria bacterium]
MKPLNVLEPLTDPFFYHDFKSALDRLENDLVNGPCYALLIGESGTGKTTLLRTLMTRLDPRKYNIIYLCHGRPSPSALARVMAHKFHFPLRYTRAETSQLLLQSLQNLPTKPFLWIDEAQMMPDDTLHEIRLLSEADLAGPPLFSVLLSGLPPLKDKLLNPDLFALWRRINPKLYLTGILHEEIDAYIHHRFGEQNASRLDSESRLHIFEHSRAIPALMDLIINECVKSVPSGAISKKTVCDIIDELELS